MEVSLHSLPFPFPESQRCALLAYRQAAVAKEKELAGRRREKIEWLKSYVQQRLREKEAVRLGHPPLSAAVALKDGKEDDQEALMESDWLASTSGVERITSHRLPSPPPRDSYVLVTAVARGFLTRRLLNSEKVQQLIHTIKDACSVLDSLNSDEDAALRGRVSVQLQSARLTLHEIMFELPVTERLAYISHSRVVQAERRSRGRQGSASRKVSAATMKSRARRQQVAVAEWHQKKVKTAHNSKLPESEQRASRSRSGGKNTGAVAATNRSRPTRPLATTHKKPPTIRH